MAWKDVLSQFGAWSGAFSNVSYYLKEKAKVRKGVQGMEDLSQVYLQPKPSGKLVTGAMSNLPLVIEMGLVTVFADVGNPPNGHF